MRRCVFFDRDGVVNVSPGPGYVERWSDFKVKPEFIDVLRVVKDLGYEAVIVTNQRGIALGVVSAGTVAEIHEKLRKMLVECYSLELLDIVCCPHDNNVCECRKPKPGMLIEAAKRHDINLSKSWMIGDSAKDIEAGHRAGCRTILVSGSNEGVGADYCVGSMADLAEGARVILSV